MDQTIRSELLGTAGLTLAASAALLLTLLRRPVAAHVELRSRATILFVVGLVFQVLHFSEEYVNGFYDLFPPLFGLATWSSSFFVIFNVSWLAIWTTAAFGLRAGYQPAFFPVWFFAIGAMANGVAHPLMSVYAGGYFPGLLTSPFVGVAGLLLWVRLMSLTEPRKVAQP